MLWKMLCYTLLSIVAVFYIVVYGLYKPYISMHLRNMECSNTPHINCIGMKF